MQETLGQLVRRLREDREMTQLQLASSARMGNGTISRIESDSDNQVRRSTLGRILKAFGDVKPLSDKDLSAFLRISGLDKITNFTHSVKAADPDSNAISLAKFTSGIPPDEARCHWYVADMINQIGVFPILKLLEGVAQIAGVALEPPVEIPRTISHVSPPVQKDGYVEQVVTDFEVPPAAPATRPLDRRRLGS